MVNRNVMPKPSKRPTTTGPRSKFDAWLSSIEKNRVKKCGPSVAEFSFAVPRIRLISGRNHYTYSDSEEDCKILDKLEGQILPTANHGGVLYWMNRDQRVQDNWALLFAQRVAFKFKMPLHICFNLATCKALHSMRHFEFLIGGIREIENECKALQIGFHLLGAEGYNLALKRDVYGQPIKSTDPGHHLLISLLTDLSISLLVTDFSPLRDDLEAMGYVANNLPNDFPFYQVDAHNAVPVWCASDKMEYAAKTIRRKLHEKMGVLLTDFPPLICHPYPSKLPEGITSVTDWEGISKLPAKRMMDERVKPLAWARPGSHSAFAQLHAFIRSRLPVYSSTRNDPTKDGLSNLSPWLNFGQISAQRCLLEVKKMRKHHRASVDAFIEEAFVRRELADNFCFYNPNYDKLEGAWAWAIETLRKHSADPRTPSYTSDEFEGAKTDDILWNAAQRQLVRDGKIHGYMRMYWAKKILEWHVDGPEEALKLALRLNDHYGLDGNDPNGYVGVMWSICGVHDQGWAERPILGKIRYMNYRGCSRKFDVQDYVAKYPDP